MRITSFSRLGLALALGGAGLSSPAWAQAPATPPAPAFNPENQPIADVVPGAGVGTPGVGASGETVTIPREVWERVLADIEALKRGAPVGAVDPVTGAPVTLPGDEPIAPRRTPGLITDVQSAEEAEAIARGNVSLSTGRRNYLLLPDISLISNGRALFSTDNRDEDRNALDLEVEMGIQGFVYPRVRYDAFIVANPGEEEAFGVEEGFLTYLGLARGLNVNVGRKFAPFGRTGEQHPHSWLYSRQLIARQNLVAGEALVGNGINLNYLLPTGSGFFARASLGYFTAGEESDVPVNEFDPSDPFFDEMPGRIGSGLRRFTNARLWLGRALSQRDELEFGASYAFGDAEVLAVENDGFGNPVLDEVDGRVRLSSFDASYRRFLGVNRRLLLRGEYFKYSPRDLPTSSASGYYGLANLRLNAFNDIGLLYERTGFPQAPGERERALSLIYTRQFSENYYLRAMGTYGDRPGQNNYSELRLQFVAGLGPHSHELE